MVDKKILADAKIDAKKKFKVRTVYEPKSEDAKIKSLIIQECANYHFNSACIYLECENASRVKCCFFCDKADCARFKKCNYFDKCVLPLMGRKK